VLGEDTAAGFTQVRMANGTEGWIPTQYLSAQPVARDRLAVADRRIATLEAQLKSLRQADGRANEFAKQTEKLQAELAEVRRISATSIANYEENRQLKASNETLQQQVTQLTERVRQLERNVMLRWMLAGGGLVLLGLLVGALIKSRPKRSSWA
jgi:SH3 domain protein